MDFLAGFLIGMFVGAAIGVFIVSLAVAAKRGDDAFNVPPPIDRGYDYHDDGYVTRNNERARPVRKSYRQNDKGKR